jgi:DNA-binding winged helix-turn-helix (wHTH) protein/tetratricopeptide (TPR) repeat protein
MGEGRACTVIYRFGPFTLEPHSGELKKFGSTIRVPLQHARILALLLERAGEVVTREEFRQRIWAGNVFVDFDHGLRKAINRLREVLGDSIAEPKFIETLPRVGYRFIAPVSVVAELAAPSCEEKVLPTIARPSTGWRKSLMFASLVTILTAVPMILVFTTKTARPLGFKSGDWVLIAAFENKTGEKLLDGTVEYALQRELEQSRIINVAPRARVNDALALMRRKADAALDEDTARQVAIRDGGIRAVLAGRVERFDDRYIVTVRMVDPVSGKTAAVFGKEGRQDQVVDTVRSMADAVRSDLGETPSVGSGHLERATTTSLAALRAFSAGMDAINNNRWSEGTALFEEATREDPEFAYAHIFAAHCYSNVASQDRAAPHYEAAFRLAAGVSERERLFILGSYHMRYKPDIPRAQQEYEALVNLYPDESWGANNLVAIYGLTKDDHGRTRALERATTARPNLVYPLAELLIVYRYVYPDPVKAARVREALLRLRAKGVEGNWFEFDLNDELPDAWRAGDMAKVERGLLQFESRTLGEGDLFQVAKADLLLGRLKAAERACQAISEFHWLRDGCLARVALEREDRAAARRSLAGMLAALPTLGSTDSGSIEGMMAARAGFLGEAEQYRRILSRVGAFYGVDGAILLARGRPSDAVERFHRAHGPRGQVQLRRTGFYLVRDMLASALARQGGVDEAIAVLEELDPTAVQLMEVYPWLHCRWQLAQLLRKRDRKDEARKVENELLHYLSKADDDHPLLVKLRAQAVADQRLSNAALAANVHPR